MSENPVQTPQSRPWSLDGERAALLVVDMQNDFVAPGGVMEVPAARTAVPRIRRLIEVCRAEGVPVIYTTHVLSNEFQISPLEAAYNPKLREVGMRDGTPGVEIYGEIAPAQGEVIIRKHRYDAFHNTNLETVLRTIRGLNGVDTVIITGTVTNVCCESTARSAFMRDFKVLFVSDGCGGFDDESHRATCKIIGMVFGRVLTTEETIAELLGRKR